MEMKLSESETSTHSRKIVVAASLLVVAIAIFLFSGGFGGEAGSTARDPTRLYFTVDEGKTWFADSASLVPPFQHDGKTATQVALFYDEGGSTPFAGYLQRYDAAMKKQLDANPKMPRIAMAGVEVKKPGAPESAWVMRNSRAGIDLTAKVVSPKGSKAVTPYEP